MLMTKSLPVPLLLIALSAPAFAQEHRGLYVSGMLGVVFSDDWDRITGNAESILGTAATSSERAALGVSAALGYRLSRHMAIEVNYVEAGDNEIEFATVPATVSIDKRLAGVSLVGIAPVTRNLEIYGRIGAAHWKLDTEISSGGVTLGRSHDSGTDLTIGAGLAYALTRHLDITGDYQRLKMKVPGGNLSLDNFLYGLRYRFY